MITDFAPWQLRVVPLMAALVLSGQAAGAEPSYSPYVDRPPPTNVYWGDFHVHTNLSADANALGNLRMTPDDAYRYARGEELVSQSGMRAKLGHPLDFLMVSDHSEFLGLMAKVDAGDPLLMGSEILRRWRQMRADGKYLEVLHEWGPYILGQTDEPLTTPDFDRSVWAEYAATADRYYAPGRFTTFIGYEWTSMPDGNNLHRNVVFRDDASMATRVLPFSTIDGPQPEALWKFLAAYEQDVGGQAAAIPHNPNLSGGVMFAPFDSDGKPITREYARTRARWEPVIEVTHYKGDSESHPYLSPQDEFADYGNWDWSNIGGAALHRDDWFAGEYAREALKTGVRLDGEVGANPFKFGLVGSTDSHTSLSATEENNWWGKFGISEPQPGRIAMKRWMVAGGDESLDQGPVSALLSSGYAALWAAENTREALFDALKRKETYATTGTRMGCVSSAAGSSCRTMPPARISRA